MARREIQTATATALLLLAQKVACATLIHASVHVKLKNAGTNPNPTLTVIALNALNHHAGLISLAIWRLVCVRCALIQSAGTDLPQILVLAPVRSAPSMKSVGTAVGATLLPAAAPHAKILLADTVSRETLRPANVRSPQTALPMAAGHTGASSRSMMKLASA